MFAAATPPMMTTTTTATHDRPRALSRRLSFAPGGLRAVRCRAAVAFVGSSAGKTLTPRPREYRFDVRIARAPLGVRCCGRRVLQGAVLVTESVEAQLAVDVLGPVVGVGGEEGDAVARRDRFFERLGNDCSG